jgi:predicted AlkP superfamily pyrophosphatase or phosphodiesterase
MNCRQQILSFASVAITAFACLPALADEPRLILQITIDQLRGDMPARFVEDRLGEGGFRYLLENGIVYADAHHPHANTETIVGHTTLSTGAYPSEHGMIGNIWLDRESGETTYNIEDDRYPLLTEGADVDEATEIDPSQRAARSEGRSPSAILVSTFSDELALYYSGQSKIFGVSVKDRGAVSMAGHSGKAFWFSKSAGQFVTSRYYYDKYPDWVRDWNNKDPVAGYAGKSWELLNDQESYVFGDKDDQPFEIDFPGYGRIFPHPFGLADGKYFTTLLTLSPAGDELTLDFAKTLISAERLGVDSIPDYLSVSFSSTDYVGHLFGPSSLESEDNLLRLDRTLADLFQFIDQVVGLDNTLIVLSADHGAAEVPAYLNEFGIEARYVDPGSWDTEPAIQALRTHFGLGEELITTYAHPYVYLNRDAIRDAGLDIGAVSDAVADELLKFEGISHAVSSRALQTGAVLESPLTTAIRHNFNPSRSGDIYVVFKPHWFLNDFDGLTVAATHGSPWRYDTFVPIIFAGAGLKPMQVNRGVETIDVAPTLSAYFGTKRPSGSWGNVLTEVVSGK